MAPSSPRPSIDSHAPFLHNLTQRLRKSSNASSQSSETPPDPVTKTEASRAARRMLLSLVRDDWEYPPSAIPSSAAADSHPSVPHREPLSYRQREESQSDIDADEVFFKRRTKSDPYKFENPEAVGNLVIERRRKRRRVLEEELSWNDGLKTWSQRRDAWTGALQQRPSKPPGRKNSSTSSPSRKNPHKSRLSQVFTHERNPSHSTVGSTGSCAGSPTSPTAESSSIASVESSLTTPTLTTATQITADPSLISSPWLPIYPPLLPADDALRDRIKPAAYPTIYSKTVVQGMAPNVPIPLCHMIPALVSGWKSEGNWPPQPAAPAAQDVKKGRPGGKGGAFAKWRKEQDHRPIVGVGAGPHDQGHGMVMNEDGKSRVRRSIGMMRKVLGGASSDGGLEELGIEFREQDQDERLKNVTLNEGLVQGH